MDIRNLTKVKKYNTYSVCGENPTGEKNMGDQATEGWNKKFSYDAGLGQGWKVRPCVQIKAHEKLELCNVIGHGHILTMWFAFEVRFIKQLKFIGKFDGRETFNVPFGAFFLNGWGNKARVNSLLMCVNPSGAFNCYIPMPFRKNANLTIFNDGDNDIVLYYQVTYDDAPVDKEEGLFHAQYNEVEKLEYKKSFDVLRKIEGEGVYLGTYFGFKTDFTTWWGEGEFKFYIDDDEHPSICYTGTEDYFGGAWNFEEPAGSYGLFSTPYTGLIEANPQGHIYEADQTFGMYRWHVADPIRFKKNLRVDVQAIGWEADFSKYRLVESTLFSIAYWYQK